MKNLCNKMPKYYLLLAGCFISIVLFGMLPVSMIQALEMESPLYRIQQGKIYFDDEKKTPASSGTRQLSTTISQAAAAEFESKGYLIEAGFPYIKDGATPFGITLSNNRINLGVITPDHPSLAETKITVALNGAKSYQVTLLSDNLLKLFNRSVTIANTTCNGVNEICTPHHAARWTRRNAYGLGYSLAGNDIGADFINDLYFRPFANKNKNERPVIIMQSRNDLNNEREVLLTTKLHISSAQTSGTYETVININAFAGY